MFIIKIIQIIDNPFINNYIESQSQKIYQKLDSNANGSYNGPMLDYNSRFPSSKKKEKIVYIFNILKSRKKEKKYLRKKYNKIISRVHNMDCLLKKIKA